MVDDQVGCPDVRATSRRRSRALIETDAFGTYHFAGPGSVTWYGLTRKLFGCGIATPVVPVTTEEFPAPCAASALLRAHHAAGAASSFRPGRRARSSAARSADVRPRSHRTGVRLARRQHGVCASRPEASLASCVSPFPPFVSPLSACPDRAPQRRPGRRRRRAERRRVVHQMKTALEPPNRASARSPWCSTIRAPGAPSASCRRERSSPPARTRSPCCSRARERAGIAYLTADEADGGPTEWLSRPVRAARGSSSPRESYQSFMDTDFTFGDLGAPAGRYPQHHARHRDRRREEGLQDRVGPEHDRQAVVLLAHRDVDRRGRRCCRSGANSSRPPATSSRSRPSAR